MLTGLALLLPLYLSPSIKNDPVPAIAPCVSSGYLPFYMQASRTRRTAIVWLTVAYCDCDLLLALALV